MVLGLAPRPCLSRFKIAVSTDDRGNKPLQISSVRPLDGLLKPPWGSAEFLKSAGSGCDGHSALTQKRSDRRCKRLMVSQEQPRTAQPLIRRDGAAVRCSALLKLSPPILNNLVTM
jgi:hypothetical protein